MATAAPRILQELEEVTRCPICLETCTDPRTLNCLHVMCHKCIQDLIQTARSENRTIIRCPMCTRESKILSPPEEYPVSFITNSLVDILNQTRSSGKAKCQPCSEEGEDEQATWICTHCGKLLCTACKKYHNRYEKDHLCLEVANLTADNIQEISVKKTLHYCSKHHDNKLDYLCVNCQELLCVACKLTGKAHKDHETVYAKDAEVVQSHKQAIKEFNSKYESLVQQYATCIEEIKQGKNTKDKEVDDCINQVEQRYQQMQKALLKQKEDLVKQAEDNRQEHHARADEEATKMEEEMKQMKTTMQKTKHIENEGTYIDIVSCSINEIRQQDNVINQKPTSFVRDSRLVAEFDRNVEELKEVFGHLKSTDQSLKEIFVCEFPINVSGLPNGLAITEKGHILITGQGSNTVYRYARDGSLVSQLNVSDRGIAAFNVASHQECTYVSDCNTGNIHVYDKDDKLLKTIHTGIGKTYYLGFTVLKNNLYVASSKKNCIHKISIKEPHKNTIIVKDTVHPPWYIDTNGEVLAIHLTKNVLVCDMEGKVLQKFGRGEIKPSIPYGILITRKKYIIIADSNNKRLVVTTYAGKLCRTIQLDAQPMALAFDMAGNVIVTTDSPDKVLTYQNL